jgi:parallel beta-helix repeat protein
VTEGIRLRWTPRWQIALVCAFVLVVPLALIFPVHASKASRLSRLEQRVDQLGDDVSALEEALGVTSSYAGKERPALDALVPRSKSSASHSKHRIRRLERRVHRLEGRIDVLESTLSLTSPEERSEIRLPTSNRRSAERRALRAIGRLVSRLEGRVETIEQAVTTVTPTPSPSPSIDPSVTPTPSPSPSPSSTPSPSPSPPEEDPSSSTNGTCQGVQVAPGSSIQSLIDANPARTTFCFATGLYRLTNTIQTRDKFPTLDLRAGAVIDGQNRGFIGIEGSDAPAGQIGTIILGGVFQHFGNASSPTWVSPLIARRNGVVDGAEFRENFNAGLAIQGSNVRITNVNTHHNGRYGMVVTNGPANVIIEDTEIAYNNTRRLSTSGSAGGTKFSMGTDGMIVRRNEIHDNYGSGLWWDGRNKNAQVYDNVIYNNYRWGIRWEISYGGAKFYHNTLTGNGAGDGTTNYHNGQIVIANSDGTVGGIEIYENTIDGTAHPVTVVHTPGREPPTRQVYIHDNTIIVRASTARVGAAGSAEVFGAAANNRFSSNTYRVPDVNGKYWIWNGQSLTWGQWQAAGQDVSGVLQIL